jgi:hypothetical protein
MFEFLVPGNLDLQTESEKLAAYWERFEGAYRELGVPWVQEPTLEDVRRFVALLGWDSVEQYQNAVSIPGLAEAIAQTFSGLADVSVGHWRIQPVDD